MGSRTWWGFVVRFDTAGEVVLVGVVRLEVRMKFGVVGQHR